MKWEWTEDSDDRVADMWMLMKRLSDCKKVVYSKWYQGRATFFSRDLFTQILSNFLKTGQIRIGLTETELNILEALEANSPLSTKELKQLTGLTGRINESIYNKSLKELFQRLLIVGFGEVDDGAFPSLAVGATEILYEDLWKAAKQSRPSDKLLENIPEHKKMYEQIYQRLMKIKNTSAPKIDEDLLDDPRL